MNKLSEEEINKLIHLVKKYHYYFDNESLFFNISNALMCLYINNHYKFKLDDILDLITHNYNSLLAKHTKLLAFYMRRNKKYKELHNKYINLLNSKKYEIY